MYMIGAIAIIWNYVDYRKTLYGESIDESEDNVFKVIKKVSLPFILLIHCGTTGLTYYHLKENLRLFIKSQEKYTE